MNVPFSRPDLSRFIQEGTDAAVSKVTFPDGTQQTTAATGDVVTGVSYAGNTLTLTRAEGSDLTTTIPTAAPSFDHKQSEANTKYTVIPWGTPGNPGVEVEITELSGLTITPTSSSQKVLLQASVLGEWTPNPHDGNISLKRIVGGTETWLDPRPVPNNRMPLNGMFALGFYGDVNSTMETCQFIFVDTPNTTAQITYKIYLKVAGVADGITSADFHFNKTKTDSTTDIYERGISTFTAECKG